VVWQTETPLVIIDREKARVATPSLKKARTVVRANQARIVQGRAKMKLRRLK